MGTLIFLFILYKIIKDNSKDKLNSDALKLVIGGTIAMSVFGVFAALNPGFLVVALAAAFVYFANRYSKKNNQKKSEDGKADWVFEGSAYEQTDKTYKEAKDYYSQKVGNGRLPKTQKARRKIIEKFDKKYDLYLSQEQIDSIVDATYFSETWKREVEDMDDKYDTVHQWFVGPTAWLRAYIHAFIPQEITSDFAQQEKIAIYSFDQVFTYAESLGGVPIEEKISRVNEKFFAQFDDISFMTAYRFLESRGIHHDLTVADPVNRYADVDELEKKYEQMEA